MPPPFKPKQEHTTLKLRLRTPRQCHLLLDHMERSARSTCPTCRAATTRLRSIRRSSGRRDLQGKVTLSSEFEEGLIRNLANRVISDGSGALDAELGHFQAAGQIISQACQRIASEAMRGASRAAIATR